MSLYTSQLGAGLGLVNETRILLGLWESGMSTARLHQVALESGSFPTVTARRLRNIIVECFAPRYLVNGGTPAGSLKRLAASLPTSDMAQLMFIFTCRANVILGDFVRKVYWDRYSAGQAFITNADARAFVERAIDDGKTVKPWSESMVANVSGYLTGCCGDFGLLEGGHRTKRRVLPFRLSPVVAAYLAHELHFSGVGDNAILSHEDWQLFGLEREDVLDEVKRLSLKGLLIIQAAGEVVRISWKLPDMEAFCDVITEGRF